MSVEIQELVKGAIANKVFPGGVIGILGKNKREIYSFGNYTYDKNSTKVDIDSIYDVASLTKTISTGFLILKLVDEGKINLEDKIQKYLPEFKDGKALMIHLLTYTLNFKNFTSEQKQNLIKDLSVEEFRKGLFDLELDTPPGTVYKYSDATADLQGRIIEKVYGENLNVCFKKYIAVPLNLQSTSLEPKDFDIKRIVPSQMTDGEEIVGVVNDPKSRKSYREGYFSGCAGLFSTVDDVLNVCEMFLNYGEFDEKSFLKKGTIEMMQKNNLDIELPTPLCTGDNSTTDLRRMLGLERKILGKSGFTGCQFLVDFEKNIAFVILSNRTFPNGDKLYPAWHDFRRKLVSLLFN